MRSTTTTCLALMMTLGLGACAASKMEKQEAPADMNLAQPKDSNPYIGNYTSRNRPSLGLQPEPGAPKLYRGVVETADYQRMLEDGYDLLGYSKFEANTVSPELSLEQAKQLKADVVLVYSKVVGNVPATVQLQQMRERARQHTDADKATKQKAMGDVLAEAEDRQLYEYFATYWAKLAPPLIGVHITSLKDEDRKSEVGLDVLAVIKRSPADKAHIESGDVLLKIGDVALNKPELLSQAASRYAGQTVEVSYLRGNKPFKTTMTLNKPQ
ncbi:MAG TPA: PDZ domain-containing protein [Methylophilaceae bacterium]|nr:PDZ domain-containing protein [Methylophilaceae bacterium]